MSDWLDEEKEETQADELKKEETQAQKPKRGKAKSKKTPKKFLKFKGKVN